MANSGQSFREFEQAGWEDAGVVANYHAHLSGVTTQSVDALLDAAGVIFRHIGAIEFSA